MFQSCDQSLGCGQSQYNSQSQSHGQSQNHDHSPIYNMMQKRGHPKGHDSTVGLPAKKKSAKSLCKPKLVPFLKFHVSLIENGNK